MCNQEPRWTGAQRATQAANTDMKHVVVDTSVAVQWIVKQEHSEAADDLFMAGQCDIARLVFTYNISFYDAT